MALGMVRAGHRVVASYDYEEKALAVHQANIREGGLLRPHGIRRPRRHVQGDLLDLLTVAPDIAELAPDIIVGGPPCQAFSAAGKQLGDDDPRARLTEAYGVIIATARPRYFVLENVPGVRRSNVYRRFIIMIRRAGYGITETIVNASYYGSAQNRRRFLCIGCLDEADNFMLGYLLAAKAREQMTVADVLGPDFGLMVGGRRLYWQAPGGAQSAGTRRTDRSCATIVRSSFSRPASGYVPRRDDIQDVQSLPRLGFPQFALLAGFPNTWNWDPKLPDAPPKAEGRKPRKRSVTKADKMLMVANAVPPPLAKSLGDCLLAHSRGDIPDIEPKIPEDYERWLGHAKGLSGADLSQKMTDLRKVKRYLGTRQFVRAEQAIEFLEEIPAVASLSSARRWNLKAAVKPFFEYEAEKIELRRRREQRQRDKVEAFDAQNWDPDADQYLFSD